jgi:hypothetical protein
LKRINDYEFYQLGSVLHPISQLEDQVQVKDCWYLLYQAKAWLNHLLADDLIPLVVAKPAGMVLSVEIEGLMNKLRSEGESPPSLNERSLGFSELYAIRGKVREFEIVLSAELQSLATYFISQKLAYETRLLIEEAERILPPSILDSLDAATIDEIRQAGRCIAFDIPTAATFHIIRATEAVIRMYYAKILGHAPKVKMRNWGAYIKNLQTSGKANDGIIAILNHIRETYRNPILHPELTITEEESHIILSVCTSAIAQMVLAINAVP